MRKTIYVLSVFITLTLNVKSQEWRVGLTYSPVTLTTVSFDQAYFIFSDYSSVILDKPKVRVLPTFYNLFNSGFYLRYELRNLLFQTELNFNTISYGYAQVRGEYSNAIYFLKYSTLSNPVLAGIRFNPDKVRHIILWGGIQPDYGMFHLRNFYSLLPQSGLESIHPLENELFDQMRNINVFSVAGIGVESYSVTTSLFYKRNFGEMFVEKNQNNANMVKAGIIMVTLNFRLADFSLYQNKSNDRIRK